MRLHASSSRPCGAPAAAAAAARTSRRRLRAPAPLHDRRGVPVAAVQSEPGAAAASGCAPPAPDARAAAASSGSAHPLDARDARQQRKPKPSPAAQQQRAVLRTAPAASDGPLPEVLAATFPDTFPTLSASRRVIRADCVLVAGELGSCRTDVVAGQQLEQLEPAPKQRGGPRVVSLEVAYEDDHLAVVRKPWGVQMNSADQRRTVAGALAAGALAPSAQPDALARPQAVHRLDAPVGGLLVVAKTASALAQLSQQFQDRAVHKVYHALLSGRLEPAAMAAAIAAAAQQQEEAARAQAAASASDCSPGSSSADEDGEPEGQGQPAQAAAAQLPPLQELLRLQLRGAPAFTTTAEQLADPCLAHAAERSADGSGSGGGTDSDSGGGACVALGGGVHAVSLPLEGKPCHTLVSVLGYSRSPRFADGWMTSVALSPVTGRKHQLRKHAAAAGHPIVGDGKHCKEGHIANQGVYLEALELHLTHPATGAEIVVRVPEPARFATLRAQQASRWAKQERAAAAGAEEEAAEQAA